MSETDPFSDSAFTSRLHKLVSLLGSAQPAEADTARRKLLEHLGQHRLSFTDLAQRLRDGHARPSFVQGGRDISLERQLAIARAAKQEAAAEAIAAAARAHALEVNLQQASFEIGRILRSLSRARLWAAAGWVVAALSMALLLLARDLPMPRAGRHGRAGDSAQMEALQPAAPADALHPVAGETAGTAAVQDLAVRLNPNDDAGVRTFLQRGDRVVIQDERRFGQQTWLLVRSLSGTGWVRAGDVIH